MTGFHNNSLPLLRANRERMFYIMSLLPRRKKYDLVCTVGLYLFVTFLSQERLVVSYSKINCFYQFTESDTKTYILLNGHFLIMFSYFQPIPECLEHVLRLGCLLLKEQ